MGLFRVALLGILVFAVLMGWSWLRSLKTPWVREHRGAAGWLVALLLLFFFVALFKTFLPKL